MLRVPSARTRAASAAVVVLGLLLAGGRVALAASEPGTSVRSATALSLKGAKKASSGRISGSTATAPVYPGECWGADRESRNVFCRFSLKRGWKATISFTDKGRNVFQLYGPGLTDARLASTSPVAASARQRSGEKGAVGWTARRKGTYVLAVVGCKPKADDPPNDTTGAYSFRISVKKSAR